MSVAGASRRALLRFDSSYQHGPRQLRIISALAAKSNPSVKELSFLVSQSASQGWPDFPLCRAKLARYDRNDVRRFVATWEKVWQAVSRLPDFDPSWSNQRLIAALYRVDGPYFEMGAEHPGKLLIVFTTMHNNFGISNLALLALLRPLGVSILILKDGSQFNYLSGVPGLGDDIASSATALKRFAEQRGITELYMTGFSSSGYASLLMSTLLPCHGYLGFSIRSDFEAGSPRDIGNLLTAGARAQLPPTLLRNLAPSINAAAPLVPYRIIYGTESERDRAHALNLAERPGVSLDGLEGCAHHTVTHLLVADRLLETFDSLLFQRSY